MSALYIIDSLLCMHDCCFVLTSFIEFTFQVYKVGFHEYFEIALYQSLSHTQVSFLHLVKMTSPLKNRRKEEDCVKKKDHSSSVCSRI